jgi:hypothetical protein
MPPARHCATRSKRAAFPPPERRLTRRAALAGRDVIGLARAARSGAVSRVFRTERGDRLFERFAYGVETIGF